MKAAVACVASWAWGGQGVAPAGSGLCAGVLGGVGVLRRDLPAAAPAPSARALHRALSVRADRTSATCCTPAGPAALRVSQPSLSCGERVSSFSVYLSFTSIVYKAVLLPSINFNLLFYFLCLSFLSFPSLDL